MTLCSTPRCVCVCLPKPDPVHFNVEIIKLFSAEIRMLLLKSTHPSQVSLREALTGTTINVPMLDGRVLPVAVSDIVSPGFEKAIHGEGMPVSKVCVFLNLFQHISMVKRHN